MLRRRDFNKGLTALAVMPGLRFASAPGDDQENTSPPWRHGISLLGDLKYGADFARFDYVNIDAPTVGAARRAAIGTFDSFNLVVAAVKGNIAQGIELVYDSLMASSLDEVASEYGVLAQAVRYPSDFSWVSFRLNPAAKWHDGRAISTDDVIWSFQTFKKLHPLLAVYYAHVVRVEKVGDSEIRFVFDAPGIRELPQVVGELRVLPKHWWEGNDPSGSRRDIAKTTLEPPLGSGPYRIKAFEAGRSIVYERVDDYWARHLPVNAGTHNLRELRFDYFRDPGIAFEAFKAGSLDWHTEEAAKNWATEYDFPAVAKGEVVREEFPIRSVGTMQAFVFNIRRAKFSDPRIRRAFNFAFDFEKMNQEFFYGAYSRINSYFDGTELAASGLPEGRELELLDALRSQVPAEVFTTAFRNPVGGTDASERANLLEAMRLLGEAGYEVRDLMLVERSTKQPLEVEFLIQDQDLERVILSYISLLDRLGIHASVRLIDNVQYVNRVRGWDFDIIVAVWQETLTPGNEQRDYWGSGAADTPGSRNLIGIKNPAVDALIERIVFAQTRAELVAATKALDRVLLWNHYVVPQWNLGKQRTARWDRFGHPHQMPRYGMSGFPALWWWDDARAARIGSSG
jgi:microcin C transport system substrate-binding protein